MAEINRYCRTGAALAALMVVGAIAGPAIAVVGCKRVGYPKGCVMR